jgi:hypothetical protein
MLEKVRRHTSLFVAVTAVAILAASQAVAQAGPAGLDADTVDGRHAWGPGASLTDRAGDLVATNAAGYLPNDIIRKAPDADLLDGLEAAAFARAAALRSPDGAVNETDNPVHWRQLKGVPASLADGGDSGSYRAFQVAGSLSPNDGPGKWHIGPFPRNLPVMFQVVPTGTNTCAVFSIRWLAWPWEGQLMYDALVDNEGQCDQDVTQPYAIYSVTFNPALSPSAAKAVLARVEATRVTKASDRAAHGG